MKKNRWLVIIIVATLLLRIPTLFEPHWFFDEGIYATVGSQWFRGAKLYKEIWDHKPPGLFAIYGFGYLLEKFSGIDVLFWAKLAAAAAVMLTQIALYKISPLLLRDNTLKRVSSGNTNTLKGVSSNKLNNKLKSQPRSDPVRRGSTWLVSTVAPALYGLFTSLPFWEGYMANGEIFMVAFSTWGVYSIVKSPQYHTVRGKRQLKVKSYFIGGVLIGLAILIKPVAIAEAFLGFLILLFRQERNQKKLNSLLSFSAGLAGPIILACLYFLARGTFSNFIQAGLIHNLRYASNNSIPFEQELVVNSVRLISVLLIIYFVWKKRNTLPSGIVLSWLILSTVTATVSFRPYIHYLIQLFPPLCLLIVLTLSKSTLSITNRTHRTNKDIPSLYCPLLAVCCSLILILIPLNQKLKLTDITPYQFDQFDYLQNFIRYSTGQKNKADYLDFFSHGVAINYKVANYIEKSPSYLINKLTNNQLFIWGGGEAPWLYYDLSKLDYLPATRYANHFHTESAPGGIEETIKKLTASPPCVIIVFPDTPKFEELEKLVIEKHNMVEQIEGVKIYVE